MALRPVVGPVGLRGGVILLEALTKIARMQMVERAKRGTPFPRLYHSGIRYVPEARGKDRWRTAVDVFRTKFADCEELVAILAAELQLRDNVDAKVAMYRSGPGKIHCVVKLPDGTTLDPSKRLGMKAPGYKSRKEAAGFYGLETLFAPDLREKVNALIRRGATSILPGGKMLQGAFCPDPSLHAAVRPFMTDTPVRTPGRPFQGRLVAGVRPREARWKGAQRSPAWYAEQRRRGRRKRKKKAKIFGPWGWDRKRKKKAKIFGPWGWDA